MKYDKDCELILNFCHKFYGKIGPNLFKVTADFDKNFIVIKFLVSKNISDFELENYRVCSTEILADYQSLLIDDIYEFVASADDAKISEEMRLKLFSLDLDFTR